MTILLFDTFSEGSRLYSRLKKDLDTVGNKIEEEHRSFDQVLKSLSGRMAELENTLMMKIENQTRNASTESTTKKIEDVNEYFPDEFYYHGNFGKGKLNFHF